MIVGGKTVCGGRLSVPRPDLNVPRTVRIGPKALLEVADNLAGTDAGPGRSRQAAHRRAVSTAYYALFHRLAMDTTRAAIPGGTAERTFTHWIVTGIDPDVGSIGEGSKPSGATDWRNDFGKEGYDGPQPPVGDDPHRYFFRLYALDAPVTTAPGDLDVLRESLDEHRLASGTLVGLYAR